MSLLEAEDFECYSKFVFVRRFSFQTLDFKHVQENLIRMMNPLSSRRQGAGNFLLFLVRVTSELSAIFGFILRSLPDAKAGEPEWWHHLLSAAV